VSPHYRVILDSASGREVLQRFKFE